MATKITVMAGETPVEGATVLVGSLVGSVLTTSIRGVVSFELSAGWEGFVDIYIEDAGRPVVSTIHLVEGATHVIDIQEIAT